MRNISTLKYKGILENVWKNVSGITNTYFNFPKLLYQTTFEWYIVVNDGELESTSDVWKFTIIPQDITPADRIWVLDNSDSDYSNPPFNDSLKLFNGILARKVAIDGFNICQTIGGYRTISTNDDGSFCIVAENVGDKLVKIDSNGNKVFEIDITASSVDIDDQGYIYVLNSLGTIYGYQLLLYDEDGNYIKKVTQGGIDIVIDNNNGIIWLVGSDIKKINKKDLSLISSIDPINWVASSVDYCSDGSIWVTERFNSNVSESQNRLLHISIDNEIIETVDLSFSPYCLRVNRSDNNVWIAGNNGIYKYLSIKNQLDLIDGSTNSWSLDIKESSNLVYVATYTDVRIFNSTDGSLINTISGFASNDQKYIAINKSMPKYNISIQANPLNSAIISGSGTYTVNEVINVAAIPNEGCKFINWTENGTVISTSNTYGFIVTENRNLVANLELIKYNISASVNPSESGQISGTGIFYYDSIAELTIIINNGYKGI